MEDNKLPAEDEVVAVVNPCSFVNRVDVWKVSYIIYSSKCMYFCSWLTEYPLIWHLTATCFFFLHVVVGGSREEGGVLGFYFYFFCCSVGRGERRLVCFVLCFLRYEIRTCNAGRECVSVKRVQSLLGYGASLCWVYVDNIPPWSCGKRQSARVCNTGERLRGMGALSPTANLVIEGKNRGGTRHE